MLTSNDEEKRSAENTAPNAFVVVEDLAASCQNPHPKSHSSETSDDQGRPSMAREAINFSHPLERVVSKKKPDNDQEVPPVEAKDGNRDSLSPDPKRGLIYQYFRDKLTYEGHSNAERSEWNSLNPPREGSEKSFRTSRTSSMSSKSDGGNSPEDAVDLQSSKKPVGSRGRSFLGRGKDKSAKSLDSQPNAEKSENEPPSSHYSLTDITDELKEMCLGSHPNTSQSTISCASPEFKSVSNFSQPLLDEKYPEKASSLTPDLSGETEYEIIDSYRHSPALNDTSGDITSSTEPSFRNLASQSIPEEPEFSTGEDETFLPPKRRLTPIEERRYPGKSGAWSRRFMKNIDDVVNRDSPDPNEMSLASTNTGDAFAACEQNENDDSSQPPEELETEHPGTAALTLLTIGICLSVFLISLDRTIVTTVGLHCPFPCLT